MKNSGSKFNLSKETKGIMATILDKTERDNYRRVMVKAERTYQEMKNRRAKGRDTSPTEE